MSSTHVMQESAQRIVGRNSAPDWWREAVIYQIYPRSFADGNGDGIGDLTGVLQRLDYLHRLGVDAIWFSPFYPSPQWDSGYDVADYFSINPEYGTLDEFDRIVARSHELGMRVIIDVVPNHTSSEFPWFAQALAAAPGSPERDRYLFRHSEHGAPNNWGSMFGGPAWEPVEPITHRSEDHGWWYLHLFDPHQPDLNWDNADVHALFERFLRFWCERGVDGFRVDVADGLVKAPGLPDDTFGPDRWSTLTSASRAHDGPYFDQDGVHRIYREWREVLERFGPDRMMVAEAWVDDPDRLARYVRPGEMHQAFNFDVLKCGWNASELRASITRTVRALASVGAPSTWVLSNHDVVRHSTRFGYPYGAVLDGGVGATDPQPDRVIGLERALAATTFLLSLPGSMYIYNGEELGLPEDTTLPDEARRDPTWRRSGRRVRGRDGCRIPLPWTASAPGAGFGGAGAPWLPQPVGWDRFAVDVEESDPSSPLHVYRAAIALRRDLGLGRGAIQWVPTDPDLVAIRNGDVVAALNAGITPLPLAVPGRVLLRSDGAAPSDDEQSAVARGRYLVEPNRAVWIQVTR